MKYADYSQQRYIKAIELLPERLFSAAKAIPEKMQENCEEVRLRAHRPMTFLIAGIEYPAIISGEEQIASGGELRQTLDRACQMSAYASAESVREGYITVEGGFRIGVCGSVVMKEGRVTTIKDISSLALRVSRERMGIADEIAPKLWNGNRFESTLIISPPGGGKTTLLRDLIRSISSGSTEHAPQRIAVVDERGEIAVCWRGMPQMNVGAHTDVLTACPKAEGIMMLLRAMNPQIIAVDEITAKRDINAMLAATNCGAALLASAHGNSAAELNMRPLYRSVLESGIFKRYLIISVIDGKRRYLVENAV